MQKTQVKVMHLCKSWIKRHWNIWKRPLI